MSFFRRYLSLVGLALLSFQAGVLAVSPFVACCSTTARAAIEEDECCKGMAPGQICPLHKHRHAPKEDGRGHDSSGNPLIRCGCGDIDPALVSLIFGLGILAAPVSTDVTLVSNPVARVAAAELWHAGSLDPPPPRS